MNGIRCGVAAVHIFFPCQALGEPCLLRCVSLLTDLQSGECELTSEFELGGAGK